MIPRAHNLDTKISFGQYLLAHGVINDPSKNVVFSLDTIHQADDPQSVSGDPHFNLYLTGQKTGNGYAESLDQCTQIGDRETMQSATKVVSGRVATFDSEVGVCGDFPLGVGYVYVDGDDRAFRLEGYSAHPEKYYEGNNMAGMVTVSGVHESGEPVDYDNGAYAFQLNDFTDCYILTKTTIE